MQVMSGHELLMALSDEADELAAIERERLEDAVPVAELLALLGGAEAGVWRTLAACRGQSATMYPARGESTAAAYALCASCEVIDECRAWVDRAETAPHMVHGVAAGESPAGRIARRRAATQAA